MSSDTDARRGGKLEDMAVHGTTIPTDSGTQSVAPSSRNERAEKAYNIGRARTNPLDPTIADNRTDMPSKGDEGLTGEVTTGTGNVLPVDIEAKRMGQDSS